MNKAMIDTMPATIRSRNDQFDQGRRNPRVTHLELFVERALQGGRRCRRCAAVHGRYVCIPSAAVRNEWRHSGSGVEILVHLLTCQPGDPPCLQVMIRVENGSQLHARAVYACELVNKTFQDGPWPLKLISEISQCDFVFPDQVEIASGSNLPTPAVGVFFGKG